MPEQIAVRIPNALAKSLDDLVSEGRFETKSEAIRAALQTLVDQERRRKVGGAHRGRVPADPQGEDKLGAAPRAATRSIEDEPW